ncbi:MAG: hypothetical protein ACRCUM_02295, partial [Mycoplasmoidaceae bacterium]
EKFVTNNFSGTISFEYKLINAITDFGFVEESSFIPVTISGFQSGAATSIEQVGNFNDIKASEFDLNIDNFSKHAKIIGYFIPLEQDDDGNIIGTTINKVEKVSFDDAQGVATFKASIQGGAINEQGKFTNESLDITFKFDGFQIVAPIDNTIPIIAGAVAGGVVLIILIVVAIVLVNNNKNKKILNEKRKPSAPGAPGAPPVNSGVAKSVSPSQGSTSPMGPQTPGATRSVPTPPPGATRSVPPPPTPLKK